MQVNDRAEFGHFEADSIVGKEEKSSALTLTERKTRRSVILKVRNRTAQETLLTLADHIRSLPQGTVKSVTFDNGTEFSSCAKLEDLFGCKVYFAHPYSAFERGSNENFNGLVRRFIPKGKNLAKYTRQDLNRIADIINAMPDIKAYVGQCRFSNCRHLKEPNCAVKAAVQSGAIAADRYDFYVAMLDWLDRQAANRY